MSMDEKPFKRKKKRGCGGGWGRQVFFLCVLGGVGRETRDGWPLLTVETKANGTLGVHMKEVLPRLVLLGSSCRYNRILSCTALVSPVQNIFSLPNFFTLLITIA
jgi:hypothetical protein